MHECVQRLLKPFAQPVAKTDQDSLQVEAREESLECLCKLLTTVGKDLDGETAEKLGKARRPNVRIYEMAPFTIIHTGNL